MNIYKGKRLAGVEKFFNFILDIVQTSLNGIVFALEAKDEYSSKHSERVAEMSRRFSMLLGYDELTKRMILVAASVHDIGKIGIPDSILLGEKKLNEDEWKIMKTHPDIGADIIKKTVDSNKTMRADKITVPKIVFERFENLEEAIRHHHERWDGKGYPEGLSGEDIPLFSRIIAICDSTDAMMSTRRYRKALSAEVCKSEIRKNSGIMYDPDLAEIFLDNWDSIVIPVYSKNLQ